MITHTQPSASFDHQLKYEIVCTVSTSVVKLHAQFVRSASVKSVQHAARVNPPLAFHFNTHTHTHTPDMSNTRTLLNVNTKHRQITPEVAGDHAPRCDCPHTNREPSVTCCAALFIRFIRLTTSTFYFTFAFISTYVQHVYFISCFRQQPFVGLVTPTHYHTYTM